MKAEIISVGTELLLGNILNTDTQYIAQKLADCGVSCYRQSVVGDNVGRISGEIRAALDRADAVIVTGGLGPTADDVTRTAVCEALSLPLEKDENSAKHVAEYFKKAGKFVTENNARQAYFPKGSVVFENRWGTANAFAVIAGEKQVFVLPGPPRELKPIFDEYVLPRLLQGSGNAMVRHKIRCFGTWESAIEERILEFTRDYSNPTVGIYAGCGEVMLQVTARADSQNAAEALAKPVVEQIVDRLGAAVYGVDVDSLEEKVVFLLKEQNKTLAVAESCTGGLLAKRITDISGASQVFGYGFVTYANSAKEELLGVSKKTLELHGAVSPETAAEMAQGARKAANADIGVALTGIAGPDGGTEEKPIGTVWVGVATDKGTQVSNVALYRPGVDREYVRRYSASYALNEVRKALSGI